jgi:phospholipid-binding lipoprotein MlaA
VFEFNMTVDRALLEPTARAYRAIVPGVVRDRVRSFIDNLAEPRIFVNDVLQGRGDAAGITFARFFVNTTAGLGGLFDQATDGGLPRQSGDFGQTLYAWGLQDGAYLVLPFFGPSNVRDAAGLGVDLYTTPPTNVLGGENAQGVEWGMAIVDGIDQRERNIEVIDEIKKSALDLYSHMRSLWRQHRATQLREARGQQQAPEELVDPEAPLQK